MTLAKLARQLNFSNARASGLPALLLLTDARRLPDPLPAARRLPRGAGVVLRHYGLPERKQLARELAAICRLRDLVFLVAGDGALAAEVGADGLHLPEALAGQARRWRRRRPDWLITVAAHGLPALHAAAACGADAALLSPVFATASHPNARVFGPLRFARLVRASRIPVYALGGVDAVSAPRLIDSGAAGIAAISGLSRS